MRLYVCLEELCNKLILFVTVRPNRLLIRMGAEVEHQTFPDLLMMYKVIPYQFSIKDSFLNFVVIWVHRLERKHKYNRSIVTTKGITTKFLSGVQSRFNHSTKTTNTKMQPDGVTGCSCLFTLGNLRGFLDGGWYFCITLAIATLVFRHR